MSKGAGRCSTTTTSTIRTTRSHSATTVRGSRRRDCHFDDTPCVSLLKHLIKVQGGAIRMSF